MRIWINCLLMLLIILATLSIAPQMIASHVINVHSVLLTPLFVTLMIGVIIVLIVIKSVLQRLFITTGSLFLSLTISILLLLTSGLYTITTVQNTLAQDIKIPIRVLAKVRPVAISDSYYDKNADMGYRQLAIIESAEALTVNHFQKTLPDPTTSNALPQLIGKKVLLSARFNTLNKKTILPTSYSTHFAGLNQLQPKQATAMMLDISPIAKHDEGFIHRWFRSSHISAQADILAYRNAFVPNVNTSWHTTLHQWRWQIREHFINHVGNGWQQSTIKEQQAQAVTLSLLTGDRALINKDTKYLYQLAGISHLLAISGTHVLFLAVMLSSLVMLIINRLMPSLYQRVSRRQLRWLVMVVGALLYALFTGFDVPSARTVYMLIAVGLTRLFIVNISSQQVLLIIAVLMAIADPYIVWQAGFWLSFVAVMVLIRYDDGLDHSSHKKLNDTHHITHRLLPFLRLQVWIFIALLPLSLLLFGKVSWWGVVINVVAIGLYGWIVVPINLLAGLIYLLIPSLATILWNIVSQLLMVVHSFLAWLVGIDAPRQAWLYTNINASLLLVMGLVALPMLLPRNTLSKIWSLPPLVLLMILLSHQANQYKSSDSNQTHHVTVRLLTPPSKTISSVLISTDDDNWLILADHNKFNFTHKKKSASADHKAIQLNQHLQAVLAKSGVDNLTGIIVQTPDTTLIKTSELLKQSIPVGYLWQAGNKTINPNNGSVSACDSGKQWRSDNGNLSIKAITGWQDIDKKALWSCAIQIDSHEPIAVNSQHKAYWTTLIEQPTDIKALTTDHTPITKQLIINSNVTDDTLWQLWDLMCTTTDDNPRQAVLLQHSYSDLPTPLMPHVENMILLDIADDTNKQLLETMVIDLD